ncbi:F0F1 ATP synthase subunit delta [uncultured Roseobacter sp.]|uniref:F0F1 ATP synthase subunit delta n=1 Tax=uncultured Roseobacter sp. TaxID=114847 RepID=UPI00262D558B|nr:F0F1 ATP synthase subunit delta [uncultured Roseobacter sp.]
MSEPASISTSIAERYAAAVYDLAKDGNSVETLEADLGALQTALNDSEDFRDLIASPIYSRSQQRDAITALAAKMELSPTVANTLALMADKRRLFVLPQLITALREIIADAKGEVVAEVVSAKALTDAQADKLASSLTASTGKTVSLNKTVDESLIGGLIVKVGSRMVDTSIRAKLNSLQNAMKEVG